MEFLNFNSVELLPNAKASAAFIVDSALLGVIDTHSLLRSPIALPVRTDGRFFEVGLSQAFLEYGLWQDYGTGRETPRGNNGDLGREKVRGRRRWFSRKYYASVMNIKEFFADNLGKQFTGIIADAFDDVNFRKVH